MKKNKKLSIWLVFTLTFLSHIYGQTPYHWQVTDEDGLPSNTVYMTLQDSRGLMWIATANGLCYYDGRNIHKIQNPALKDNEILKIREGIDGNIWGINLSGQLFKCNTKQMAVLTELGNSKLDKIKDLEWIGYHLFLVFNININFETSCSYNFFSNTIQYIKNTNRFYKPLPNVRIIKISDSEYIYYNFNSNQGDFNKCNIFDENYLIYQLCPSSTYVPYTDFYWKGNLFMSYNGAINYTSLKQKRNIKNLLKEKLVSYNCSENYLFLTCEKNIYVFDDKLHLVYTIPANKYNYTYQDKEKNIWISTTENGLLIYPNINLSANSTIPPVYTIQRISEDKYMLGTADGFIYQIDNLGRISNKHYINQGKVNDIAFWQNKYFVASNNFIKIYDNNFKKTYASTTGAYKKVLIAKDGKVYCANSLYFVQVYPKDVKIIPIRCYSLLANKNNILYIATPNGIFSYDLNNTVKSAPSLANNYNKGLIKLLFTDTFKDAQPNVSAMTTDTLGRIWATTHGSGVIIIKDEKIEKILDDKNAFATNTFNCIYAQGRYVWLGSDKGVYQYDVFSNKIININKYDGIPTNEILSLAASKDKQFIGTSKGLSIVPINGIEQNLIPPNININAIKINDVAQHNYQTDYKLDYHQNNIEIDFISYQYKAKGDARYEYRITELDTQWTITTERSLRFTNLRSGNYHLEIRAINEDDIRSDKNITLHFEILRPFWLQWWFYLLLTAGATVGIFAFLRRKYRRELRFEDLKMQALQAQMNPHFIFNALNAIQHFLTSNDENNAIKYLSQFARLIRTVFEYNKKKEISLAEEIDMLSLYLSLEKLRFNQKIAVHLNISKEAMEEKQNIYFPPLLIQPIVENSFKHGLFHKLNNGNLWIDFILLPNNRLKCVIKDDGVGRDYAQNVSKWKGIYVSSGVKATQQRLDFWHKQLQTGITEYFIIEDLFDNNIPAGTCVTLIL